MSARLKIAIQKNGRLAERSRAETAKWAKAIREAKIEPQ